MNAHVAAYWEHWYDRWVVYTDQWEYFRSTRNQIPPYMHPDFARNMKRLVELKVVQENT